MLIWRTQGLVEELCEMIKGRWTQHRIALARWSYFYWLIIVQHAWEIHRWVHGTPKKKKKPCPLVLHNAQLCMGAGWGHAGRGRCQWSSQCLQVILFIIQMQTLFHYPWGSGSNVLMSLTRGRLLVRADSTAPVLVTDDERQKADRGRQKKKKQVITSYLHVHKGDSPQHSYFCVL